MDIIRDKFKETILAILPIVIVVIGINFFISPLPNSVLSRFLISAVLIVFGLTLFLFGVEICITPLSAIAGSTIAKRNKLSLVIGLSFLLGFVISIAEPDLLVLASQVSLVSAKAISVPTLLITVSAGMALLIAIGFIRVIYSIPLVIVLRLVYVIIGLLALVITPDFLAIAFDASGATTGIIAVPFMLAFASGISHMKQNSQEAENDAFGLVAVASAGAIIAVLLLAVFSSLNLEETALSFELNIRAGILSVFGAELVHTLHHALLAIAPILLIFVLLQFSLMKMSRSQFVKRIKGLLHATIGLICFFMGVNAGFIDLGKQLGYQIVQEGSLSLLLGIAFIFGLVSVLAEPAVHILAEQIQEVTGGSIPKIAVFLPLTTGVGMAVLLSVLRIQIPQIQLWHYLLPGYVIALLLTWFVPPLFVGIAFDAGGVATGPMTATFILAFTTGVASRTETANVLIDGFGMIALVALAPILTLQFVGLLYQFKRKNLYE